MVPRCGGQESIRELSRSVPWEALTVSDAEIVRGCSPCRHGMPKIHRAVGHRSHNAVTGLAKSMGVAGSTA